MRSASPTLTIRHARDVRYQTEAGDEFDTNFAFLSARVYGAAQRVLSLVTTEPVVDSSVL